MSFLTIFVQMYTKLMPNLIIISLLLALNYLSYSFAGDVCQFVFVTAIDSPSGFKNGVPHSDIEHAYSNQNVREVCSEASRIFDIDKRRVFPVSNYFEETETSDAKNAMSIIAFKRVFEDGLYLDSKSKEMNDRHYNPNENNDYTVTQFT